MQTVNVIRGHLTGPTTVELDEPAPPGAHDVEARLRVVTPTSASTTDNVSSFLRTLPPGTSTKDEIVARVRAERDEWAGR